MLRADVRLPGIFSDHAVLQRAARVPVWGWADAGEVVTVELGGAEARAVAGRDGKWRTNLDLSGLGAGPFELVVAGKNRLVVRDVLVGEVWLISGQSNMEWTIDQSLDPVPVIAASKDPQLRHFKPKVVMTDDPADDVSGGEWKLAGPETTGRFSAVGYYFARELRQRLGAPVGLVNLSLGGSGIEAWVSEPALRADPRLTDRAKRDVAAARAIPGDLAAWREALPAWERAHGREDAPDPAARAWAAPETDWSDARLVSLPATWSAAGVPPGAVWLSRTFELTPAQTHFTSLELGAIEGADEVFVNGRPIGATARDDLGRWRNYPLPPDLLKAGSNVITVRVFFSGGPQAGLRRKPELRTRTEGLPLDGEWRLRVERELPPAPPGYPARPVTDRKYLAAQLFNGLVAPIAGYRIAGALWYQGETNIDGFALYPRLLAALVRDWRTRWQQGNFPFYLVQLPGIGPVSTKPDGGNVARLREAQESVLALPNTGRVVLIDSGDPENIHPGDKLKPGSRLARLAARHAYGQTDVLADSPRPREHTIENGEFLVRFDTGGSPLTVRPLPKTYRPDSMKPAERPLPILRPESSIQGFALAGSDGVWHWAKARLRGNDLVIVSAPEVPNPVALRYAWSDFPVANLFNTAGLPAAPFRIGDSSP